MASSNYSTKNRPFRRSIAAVIISTAFTTLVGASFASAEAASGSSEEITQLNISAVDLPLKYRPAPANRGISGRYIVVLKDQFVSQQMSQMAEMSTSDNSSASMANFRQQAVFSTADDMAGLYSAEITHRFHATLSGFVSVMSHHAMKNLMNDDRVEFIEQDQIMSINATQYNATWGLDRVDQINLPLDAQYSYVLDGSGVDSYVIDTGILSDHSDFEGRVVGGYTAISDGRGTNDCNGHGTHVAGTMGSTTYGVAKNTNLIPVRVLGCDGSGSNSGVIAGVDWVAQNASGPSVANMSLGGGSSVALDNAVQNAINNGITFVVAAGNSNTDACIGSPNRVPEALTVASSTSTDARSSFSSWGSCVDLFAPGSAITSTWSNGGTQTISGTSMASPHVAGVVALYLQSNPGASPSQVENALESVAAVNKISNSRGSPNLLVQSNFDSTPPPPTPTPQPTPNPGDNVLQNGVPVTGLAANQGNDVIYTMEVPAGASDIVFSLSGGSGDADLYVRFGAVPSDSTYDCRPYLNGNNETCTGTQSGGTYYVRVRAYSSFSGATLVGSYTAGGSTNPPIDTSVNDISVGQGDWVRYSLELPSGYENLRVAISGGAGDADLHVNFGSPSSTSDYDCRPYRNGNNEACAFDSPQEGTWYIYIRGYRAASGITLRVTAD